MEKHATTLSPLLILALSLALSCALSGGSRIAHYIPETSVSLKHSQLPKHDGPRFQAYLAAQYVDSAHPLAHRQLSRRSSATRLFCSHDSTENALDLDSSFSQMYHDDYEGLSPPFSGFYGRDHDSLVKATEQFLKDRKMYPMGRLSEEDVETMTGLMAAWARERSLEAALTVEALLKRIIDDLKAGNSDIHVRTRHYTLTIDAWSKSNAPGASGRAQQIHDTMKEEYEQTGNIHIRPNVLSCTTLINAWAKSNETIAPMMAERILQGMIKDYSSGQAHMKPDAVTFSTVINAYCRLPGVSGLEACRRCEELFQLMDEMGVRKNVYTYSALQNVYTRSRLPDALDRVLSVLKQMQKLSEEGDAFAKPNRRNYNNVLAAAGKMGTEEAGRVAQQLIQRMENSTQDGGVDVQPNRVSYYLAMLACCRVPNKTLAEEMTLEVFERIERRAMQEEIKREKVSSAAPPIVQLDVECFNIVLTALSHSCDPSSIFRIKRLLRKMQRYADEGKSGMRPNVRSWNTLLNALARNRSAINTGDQARNVLRHMFRLHIDGVPGVLPDAFSFAAVLTAYQREASVTAAEAADHLVQEMENLYELGKIPSPPDVYHYTILVGVWGKSEQGKIGADRCVQILTHMMELHNAGYPQVKPNVHTFNAVLDCLARSDDGERVEQLLYHMLSLYRQGDTSAKPDAFSFNCAISAFTRSKKKGSGRRAEAILDLFLEYHENENSFAQPNLRSFTNIIVHYARSRYLIGPGGNALDAPYRAEYVFNRMVSYFKDGREYLEPNVFSVTTVMDTYSYAQHPDAGANAERLLRLVRTLRERYGAKRLVVNTSLLNSVLFAWANSGDENAGNRAASHVDFMENEYAAGNKDLMPDTRTYTLLLSAISKSSGLDKARKAIDVINRMKFQMRKGNTAVILDELHFSLAINACAFSNADVKSEVEAFKIATGLFDELLASDNMRTTSLVFGWFIQCCGRLKAPEAMRNTYLERAFHRCCSQGLVNDFVLSRLLGAAPEELLDKLFGPANINGPWKPARIKISMLPGEWTSRTSRRKRDDFP